MAVQTHHILSKITTLMQNNINALINVIRINLKFTVQIILIIIVPLVILHVVLALPIINVNSVFLDIN